jgi:glycosyltransferase involved in cell wall biosynthesis
MGRVPILVTTDAIGGVWTYAAEVAAGLAQRGFAPLLAVVGPPGSPAQHDAISTTPGVTVRDTGLPLDWTADGPDEIAAAAEALAVLAREIQACAVLLHAPALAAADYGQPVVAVHHSCQATWWQAVRPGEPMPPDFAWRARCVAEGLAAADLVLAPTAAHADAVAVAYDLSQPPRVVHNGRRHAANLAASRDTLFVLTAGRLWDEGKNLAALDAAAKHLCAPLLAAGPLHSPWGSASLANGKALGPMDAAGVRRWMARAPVFASMALYEPFGYCVLEAAQCGCALVLADTPGFRELWDGAAVFVPAHEPDAIAGSVNALLFDLGRMERLGKAARQRSARYGTGRMVRAMAGLIHDLAGTRRGAAA